MAARMFTGSVNQGVSVSDQYNGTAAKLWDSYLIGDVKGRTQIYKNFLVGLLREHGCQRVLDTACGTGVDSILLLEDGFNVTSVDASDKMLKYALRYRWDRRKEDKFDKWVIEEGNWVTLRDDIEHLMGDGFDALVCLGNSFTHLLDHNEQIQAMENFKACLRPGGLLIIDHRNFDYITQNRGLLPSRSIYYDVDPQLALEVAVVYVKGKPQVIKTDFSIDVPKRQTKIAKQNGQNGVASDPGNGSDYVKSEFSVFSYPHELAAFSKLLKDVFGTNAKHKVYGDYKKLEEIENPTVYIHVVEKEDTRYTRKITNTIPACVNGK